MSYEIVQVLKKALLTLSLKFPFSTTLNALMSRDFSLISEREAYDTLRYLLNACGQVVELTENSFDDRRWKSADPDTKRRVEKCKRYVFDTIKTMSKENKVPIPKLKKSDLPVIFYNKYSSIYFSSCVALANYALSYQLENHGLKFWPRIEDYQIIKMTYSNLKEDECCQFEIQEKNLLKEIEILEDFLKKLTEKKSKIETLLEVEISKCKYSCALQEESDRSKILSSWKKETDELHKRNIEKIKTLENLNEQLTLLAKLLDKKEKVVINGDDLRKNIQCDVENFAEMNGLPLINENRLDIHALFKTFHLSFPKVIKNKEMLRELFSLKLPVIDTGLMSKLESQKKRLEKRCEDFLGHYGDDKRNEASAWLKNFLFHIPKIEFIEQNSTISTRDPVFDEEKLLCLIKPCEKTSHWKANNMEFKSKRGYMLHKFNDNSAKYLKKKDIQMAVKRDSKKQLKRINRRKSISLINLSSLSVTSIKSANSEKISSPCGSEASQKSSQKLCSTPKENHSRSFIHDKNISPISVLSAKDKSFVNQPKVSEINVSNDSILNESDLHTSLLNSYRSADLDLKSENKQDTFEFTNSINVTLDSSPSGVSINLSL